MRDEQLFSQQQEERQNLLDQLAAISKVAYSAGMERGIYEAFSYFDKHGEMPTPPEDIYIPPTMDEYIELIESQPMIKAFLYGEFNE